MYYSKTTKGFYDTAIHTTIPDDAVKISAAEHAGLLAAQAAGKHIRPGKGGKPEAVDQPDLTGPELQARTSTQTLAQITALERQQARPLREIVLALCAGQSAPQAALVQLNDCEAQIVALRSNIK